MRITRRSARHVTLLDRNYSTTVVQWLHGRHEGRERNL